MSMPENNGTGSPEAVTASPSASESGLQHQQLKQGMLNEMIIIHVWRFGFLT